MSPTTISLSLPSSFALYVTSVKAAESTAAPHPVPWEFASERYAVRVNGQSVSVMLTAMNLHAASFDFTGKAEVQIEINANDYNRTDGRTHPHRRASQHPRRQRESHHAPPGLHADPVADDGGYDLSLDLQRQE